MKERIEAILLPYGLVLILLAMLSGAVNAGTASTGHRILDPKAKDVYAALQDTSNCLRVTSGVPSHKVHDRRELCWRRLRTLIKVLGKPLPDTRMALCKKQAKSWLIAYRPFITPLTSEKRRWLTIIPCPCKLLMQSMETI